MQSVVTPPRAVSGWMLDQGMLPLCPAPALGMETGAGCAHPSGKHPGGNAPSPLQALFVRKSGRAWRKQRVEMCELSAHPKQQRQKGSAQRDSQEMELLEPWRKCSSWHGAELCFSVNLCLLGSKKSPSKEPLLSRQKAAPCFEQSLE